MVALEFIEYISKFKVVGYLGVQDLSDNLNHRFIPMILTFFAFFITFKLYFLKSISCYAPTTIGGINFENYMENYCYSHRTYSLPLDVEITHKDSFWNTMDRDNMVSYYQFVPLVLCLQGIMFALPFVLWSYFTYSKTGVDLEKLIVFANKATYKSEKERDKLVCHVVNSITGMLFMHRDYRTGKYAMMQRRWLSRFVPSKRLGNWIYIYYLFIKVLDITNIIGQIYFIQLFLKMGNTYTFYGYELLRDIIAGRNWQQTLIFPLVTFCRPTVRNMGTDNSILVQCVLPINMLNEKIYIFIWWLFVFALFTSCFKLVQWIFVLCIRPSQRSLIKRSLKITNHYSDLPGSNEKKVFNDFVNNFLRKDGQFLIHMICINNGDLITTDIVVQLFELYKSKLSKNHIHIEEKQMQTDIQIDEETIEC